MMIGKNTDGRQLRQCSASAYVEPTRRSASRWFCTLFAAAFFTTYLSAAAIAGDRLVTHGGAQGTAIQVADAADAPYWLEIVGDIHVRFRADCRALKTINAASRQDKLFVFVDQAPAKFEMGGRAVECIVRKINGDGMITVMLRRGDGVPVAYSTLVTRKHLIRLRSAGAWGLGGWKAL